MTSRRVLIGLAVGLLGLMLVGSVHVNWRRRQAVAALVRCDTSQVWCSWTSPVWCWVPAPPVRHFSIMGGDRDLVGTVLMSTRGDISVVSLQWHMVDLSSPPPRTAEEAAETAVAIAARYWHVGKLRVVSAQRNSYRGSQRFDVAVASADGAMFDVQFLLSRDESPASVGIYRRWRREGELLEPTAEMPDAGREVGG